MREIKFRAFYIPNKEMNEVWLTGNGVGFYDEKSRCVQEYLAGLYSEPMQFTGLQDKNGKDIYEGDIVIMHQFLFDGNEVEKEVCGEIGWDEYGLTLRHISNEFVEEYCGYDSGEGEVALNAFYGLHEESWEVIGNIHENPELLEPTK